MKIKLVVIDLEIPAKVKKWAIRLGIPAATLVAGGGIAWAAGLHVWSTGDTLQASDLNANFANLQQQITPTSLGTRAPSAFRAEFTTQNFQVPSSTSTPLLFNVSDYDLAGEYSTSTGIFTAANAGIYSVSCEIEYFSENSNLGTPASPFHDFSTVIYKDSVEAGGSDTHASIGSDSISSQTVQVVQLAAGDTIYCAAYQDTGISVYVDSSLNNFLARTSFSATRLY